MAYTPINCSVEQYEQQVYSGENHSRLYIKHGNTIIGTEAEDYASPFASNMIVTSRILKNGSNTFSLNNFVSKEIDLTLHDYLIDNLEEELDIKIGTYIESVDTYEYVPIGIFKIQNAPTTDKGVTTYKLRDKSVNFDFNYDARELINNSEKQNEDGDKYVTKLEILLDICSKANVNYVGSQTFIGYDDPIGIYDNTITGRVYVSYIAEQSGCIATIDRNGNLTFIPMNLSLLTTKEINEDIVESFENGEDYSISKVIYESGTIYFENGNDTNDKLFISASNPYIANQEQLNRIANELIGFNINSFKTGKVLGNPLIDSYDIIELNYNNKTYRTFAQNVLTFNGVLTSTFETSIKLDTREVNTTIKSEPAFRKIVKQEIDNVNATINVLVEDVDSVRTTQSSQALEIEVISRNIDENGNIISVDTQTGYRLDKDGLKITKNVEEFNTLIDNTGTYYKDGDTILAQTTKDNIIMRDLVLYGKYYYGVDEDLDVANFTKDDAMFVSELYEDNNGEQGFGHFYNGGDI